MFQTECIGFLELIIFLRLRRKQKIYFILLILSKCFTILWLVPAGVEWYFGN